MNFQELTGRSHKHLTYIDEYTSLHSQCLQDFLDLRKQALKEKIELKVASSYRSFNHQQRIWNEKVRGIRKVLDKNEKKLDISKLTKTELMWEILNWSAIPGASRHHWGTDFDLYDASSYQNEKKLLLINNEYTLNTSENFRLMTFMSTQEKVFFSPYTQKSLGHGYEPWHFSHKKISKKILDKYTLDVFKSNIKQSPSLLLQSEILNNLEEIYSTYICV